MIIRHRKDLLHHNRRGWVADFHFNFQDLYVEGDELFFGVSHLVVFNDDRASGNFKWPMHGHSNAEIVTFLIKGQAGHNDSLGNTHVMHSGDFQMISAGTGIEHSESLQSPDIHIFQMWFVPKKFDVKPKFSFLNRQDYVEDGSWFLGDKLNTNARIAIKVVDAAFEQKAPSRNQYIVVIEGAVTFNNQKLESGDAVVLRDENASVDGKGKIIIIDMPIDDDAKFKWYRHLMASQK